MHVVYVIFLLSKSYFGRSISSSYIETETSGVVLNRINLISDAVVTEAL